MYGDWNSVEGSNLIINMSLDPSVCEGKPDNWEDIELHPSDFPDQYKFCTIPRKNMKQTQDLYITLLSNS